MRIKDITYIYIIATILIALIVLSYVYKYDMNTYEDKLDKLVADSYISLDKTNEMIDNYNQLYDDYQLLYYEYYKLKQDIPKTDWKEFTITAYSANDPSQGTSNLVRTGFNLDKERVKQLPIIAVDPDVIPLYSVVEIKDIGTFLALDTGGAIKGERIDILMEDKSEALEFGKQTLNVRILN